MVCAMLRQVCRHHNVTKHSWAGAGAGAIEPAMLGSSVSSSIGMAGPRLVWRSHHVVKDLFPVSPMAAPSNTKHPGDRMRSWCGCSATALWIHSSKTL